MKHRHQALALAIAATLWLGATARADDAATLATTAAALKTAKTQLEGTAADKAGHRDKALAALKTAITEVDAAVAAAKPSTPATPTGPAIAAATDKKTERLWKAKCSSCHGDDGKGKTDQGTKQGIGDMSKAAWHTEFTDAKIMEIVAKGIKREKDGKKQEMAPFAKVLTADQIKSLIGHIRTFKGK